MTVPLGHEKIDAYQAAVEMVGWAEAQLRDMAIAAGGACDYLASIPVFSRSFTVIKIVRTVSVFIGRVSGWEITRR